MAFPSWLKKLPAILKKIVDIAILGRQAGLWDKAPKPFMRSLNFVGPVDPVPAYSWLYALHKLLKNFLLAVVGVLVVHLSNPTELAAFLGVLPETAQKLLIPFAVPLAMAIKNWWSHRNDVVQYVVPVEDKLAVPVPIVVKPPENQPVRSDSGE